MENNNEKIKLSDRTVLINTKNGVYAYNSLLGGLRLLSNEELTFIQNISIYSEMEEYNNVKEELSKNGLISYYSQRSEYDVLVKAVSEYKERVKDGKSITKLLLAVTDKCMLRCRYCYVPEAACSNVVEKNINEDMCWDVAQKSIDEFYKIIQRNHNKKVHVRFHGGEPLVNFNIIRQSMDYIEAKFQDVDVMFHMNTNGVLMTKEIAEYFVAHNINIEISIDGLQEVHDNLRPFHNGKGSFDSAVRCIRMLLDSGFDTSKMNFAVTLNNKNLNELSKIIDLAAELNIKDIEINTLLFESEWDILDDIDKRVEVLLNARIYGASKSIRVTGKWFKLLERLYTPVINYCGRMGQQIGVDANGDVFLCTGYLQKFGNINSLNEIFNKQEYINVAIRGVGNIKECIGCEIEGACAGGCAAAVVKTHNNVYHAEKKECEFRKKMVKKLIENIDLLKGEGISFEEVDSSYVPTIHDHIR